MANVTGKFAVEAYPRDQKSRGEMRTVATSKAPLSGEYRLVDRLDLDAASIAEAIAELKADRAQAAPIAEAPAVDPKAARAARDKRIDDVMTVIEALHGHTLAELAK